MRKLLWLCLVLFTLMGSAFAQEAPKNGVPKNAAVEIIRDKWGVPHIFAARDADGFFGLGWACAEDRLLQMDLFRRKAAGRLAEVFGSEWLKTDQPARIAGFAQHAANAYSKLPEQMQGYLSAYAAGVNAWMEAHPEVVARRFKAAGYLPEPWTPADCILAERGILALGSPFKESSIRSYHEFQDLLARYGENGLGERAAMVIDDEGAIVSEAEFAKDKDIYARLKQMKNNRAVYLKNAPESGPKFSHAWAVGGSRSTTGKPILESDPQLPVSNPPFWYEFHMAAGAIDARGIGLAGVPGLFVGFNRHVAWGGTALGADAVATYVDKLSADGKGFEFKGETVPFERRLERIEVKGEEPVIQEVLSNRHGSVFNSLAKESNPGEAYVCHNMQVMEGGSGIQAMIEFMTAGNWNEFRTAMAHYYDPGLNIVYADAAGNLAYHTMVTLPQSENGSLRQALEGWTGEQELTGRIPFELLPHMLNPESGAISHANNMPVGSWYPIDMGLATGGTGDTDRSWRLRQLLAGDRKFSIDDFESVLHRDDVQSIVAAMLPAARKVAADDVPDDPAIGALLEAVKDWDMHYDTTDPAYRAAMCLAGSGLTAYRPSGLNARFGAGGGGVVHVARAIERQFAETRQAPQDPAMRAFLVDWLALAAKKLNGGDGRDGGRDRSPNKSLDTASAEYQVCPPANLPNVDPAVEWTSPKLACTEIGTIWSQSNNSYSQIVDLADVDNSRSIIPPSNTEDPESPYYMAAVDLWVKGTMHPAPLTREKVEAFAADRETVTPKAYEGPVAHPFMIVKANEIGTEKVVAAIPAPNPAKKQEELPGRKPDDPRLEGFIRALLQHDATAEDVSQTIAQARETVKGDQVLTEELIGGLRLMIYLEYGTDEARNQAAGLLKELGGQMPPERPAEFKKPRPSRNGREGRRQGRRMEPESTAQAQPVSQVRPAAQEAPKKQERPAAPSGGNEEILPEMLPNAERPFKIVRSLPISEPTWGGMIGKSDDTALYLVGAERSILVYKKTGPQPEDYQQVNQIFPGPEADIENCIIAGDRLYVGAGQLGLLVYDTADLAKPNVRPILEKKTDYSTGWLALDGERLYVSKRREGGISIYDCKDLSFLGQGLDQLAFDQFTVASDTSGNPIIYGSPTDYPDKLTIIDARDPANLRLAGDLTNPTYKTFFVAPPIVVGQTLYTTEMNGGVGVYDLANPLAPVLKYRFREAGEIKNRRGGRSDSNLPVTRQFMTDGKMGFITRDNQYVEILKINPDGMEVVGTLMESIPKGNSGLLSPSAFFLSEGRLAIPTKVEGIRFYNVADPAAPRALTLINLPSRFEATAKVGRMVYSSNDVDGVWQTDWEAKEGPRIVKGIPLKGLSEDLVLYKKHLYVANGQGLGIIDVSDEKNPHEVNYWDAPFKLDPGLSEGWFEGVTVDEAKGILYVAMGRGGVAIFDLANPAQPRHLTTLAIPKTFCRDLSLTSGGKLLGCAANEALYLIDVTDPAKPQILSHTDMGTGGGVTFSQDGRYAVLIPRGNMLIYDIQDPAKPVLVKRVPWRAGGEDSLFYKNYLLCSGQGSGIWVFRIGDSIQDLTLVQRIPAYFYNSKFTVEGDRIFVNSIGLDELKLVE